MQNPQPPKMQSAQTELRRLAREGEQIGGRALPDAADHAGDRVEIWGRRIGRALGWAAALFLLVQLIRTYAG